MKNATEGGALTIGAILAVAVVAGIAYEILRGSCYLADLATGRRAK